MKNLKFIILFIFLGFFIVLTFEVYESILNQNENVNRIDLLVLSKVVKLRTPFFNNFFSNVTSLGSEVVMSLIVLFCLLIWKVEKNYFAFYNMIFISVGSTTLIVFLKRIIERPRPNISYQLIITNGFSYPSGHSLISSAVFFSIAQIISENSRRSYNYMIVRCFLYILIFLVCFSRIYLGVHFLSDVIGGALLGLIYAKISNLLFVKVIESMKKNV